MKQKCRNLIVLQHSKMKMGTGELWKQIEKENYNNTEIINVF